MSRPLHPVDEADLDRLATLRGEIAQAVERSRLAGGDRVDAIVCLGGVIGEIVAELPARPPLSAVLVSVARVAGQSHRTATERLAREAELRRSAEPERY